MSEFDIQNNTMVITSTFVLQNKMPILYVTHECDESEGVIWQFHCGNNDYDMSKMLLVRLETILGIDPTVSELAKMPVGCSATRKSQDCPWTISEDRGSGAT